MLKLAELWGRRRRYATAVLLIGAAVIAVRFWPVIPRDTELELIAGAGRDEIAEVKVAYQQQGRELRGASFAFEHGAPPVVRHRASLAPGVYRVVVDIRLRNGSYKTVEQVLQVPVDGIVRVQLL